VKNVLVAGAGGAIGGSLVRMLLARGDVQVFATSRSQQRLDDLRKTLEPRVQPLFVPIAGDAGDFSGASEVAERVEKLGGIDCAVAIFGRGVWTSGPLLDLSPGDWRTVLDEMLTAHFAFAQAVFPILSPRPGSLYVSLGGGAAFGPMRNAGLMSIAAAGQMMLTRILDRESTAGYPRVIELIINAAVGEGEPSDASQISADEVAHVLSELLLTGTTTWTNATSNGPLIVMNPGGTG
jgi:NAD(P)-dependent dehydrogenase (short-subunit alcohol dehydrogenase family)